MSDKRLAPMAITPGEPAGIGPELVLMLAQKNRRNDLVVICDPGLLTIRARETGLSVKVHEYTREMDEPRFGEGEVTVLPVSMGQTVTCGTPHVGNAQYVLDTLRRAVNGCVSGTFSAMVTGPVHKGIINEAGVAFTGHTEFLQQLAGVPRVVMMLATPGLRVALATTHIPLSQVPVQLTHQRLTQVIGILAQDLKARFGIDRPTILVAGLNPHAGEGGHLGREELDVIGPVLAQFAAHDLRLIGPLPADTLFTPHWLEQADAVLAMYHDQGLPVLKYKGFGKAVNITLGLPFVRTSVDHGTALDLAGTLKASTGSLEYALEVAATMIPGKVRGG